MGDTIVGGYYLGTNGEPHDAMGRPVKKRSEKALREAKGKAAELTDEQKAALTEQAAAEQKRLEAEEAAEKADVDAKAAGTAVKSADKSAKESAKAK